MKQKTIAFDLEHDGLHPLKAVVWSFTYSLNGKKPVPITNPNGLKLRDIPKEAIKALKDPEYLVIAHNVKNDCAIMLGQFGILCTNLWCTMESERDVTGVAVPVALFKKKTLTLAEEKFLAAYGLSYDRVIKRYFPKIKIDKTIRENFIGRPKGLPFSTKEKGYMVTDVEPLTKLQQAQEFLLRRDEQIDVALLENRYAYKAVFKKVYGFGIDKAIWLQIAEDNEREFRKRRALLPREVENWNSEKQVKAYFKYNHNIIIPTYRSSTPEIEDLDSLYLKTRNKVLGNFILYRELHKAVTSYGRNWFEDGVIDEDGRIRPNISQQKETGRISISNPNLLNLPSFGRKDYEHERVMGILYKELKQERLKPRHRHAFVPAKGKVFVIGDFGGQEIGVAAAASGERLWLDALLRGDDVHGLTAAASNPSEWQNGYAKGCTFPKKCKCPGHQPVRERAKVSNFRKLYGGGIASFAKATGMSTLHAKRFMFKHDKALKKLNKYLDRSARTALDTGVTYSASPYRRKRILKADKDWRIENQGKNHPIQGAGADMVKLAVISIPDKYYQPLDIYDEIILEVPYKEGPTAAKALKSIMEKSADYITGIPRLIKVEPKIQINLAKDDKAALVKYPKSYEYGN